MSNEVYANTMEVSCKAAAGKSIAAFPDVCFTPPLTPATPPGVPLPYPNTGMASDTSGGSKTVQISGQEVMLKDSSFFKTSSGDEAGSAPKKGVLTSQIKGKAYFTAWSMDVKVEGENVVRHLDMTTHNHASMPGNSPPWVYTDNMAGGKDECKGVREEAEDKCGKAVKDNTYSTGRINQSGAMKAMCKNTQCKKAMKCVLVPYKAGCCGTKTPHHVIPAHCFMPPGAREGNTGERYDGCQQYNIDEAPCLCVEGEGKEGEHGEIHAIFDKAENKHKPSGGGAGTWTYDQASDAGASSVSKATENECKKACTQAQLDNYHKESADIDGGTKIRADSGGNATPPASLVTVGALE